MKPFNAFISALCLSLAALTQAGPLIDRADTPTPTSPFTIAAYESPYPTGQGLTGYNVTARNGNFYLSPKASVQKAVFFVSGDGRAYLDSKKVQPAYIDTYSGLFAYVSPAPPGALFVDFVHRGHGTTIYYQGNGFTSTAPGTFDWIASFISGAWSACATGSANEYQLYKVVSNFGGTPDQNSCRTVFLSALDYTATSPAVDSY